MGGCSSIGQNLGQPLLLATEHTNALSSMASFKSERQSYTKSLRMIDHQAIFMADNTSFLNSITVYYDEYVVGLKSCYEVNGVPTVLDLMGTGYAKQKFTLTLKEDEFIEHLILYYDELAIICMKVQTTDGVIFTIGNYKNGNVKRREIDLRKEGRIILGFKGLVGEFLQDLWIYHAELSNDSTEGDDSQ